MPETILRNPDNSQIIAGVFSHGHNADVAIEAFRDVGVPEENIQVVVELTEDQAEDATKDALVGRGFAESQALFYEKAVQNGKFLVSVHDVTDPATIIEIFDKTGAEFNPDGSRNVRQDVVGLTAGAAVGAVAGAVVGTVLGGPVGGAAGVAAGAVIGGAGGTAAGKVSEHRK